MPCLDCATVRWASDYLTGLLCLNFSFRAIHGYQPVAYRTLYTLRDLLRSYLASTPVRQSRFQYHSKQKVYPQCSSVVAFNARQVQPLRDQAFCKSTLRSHFADGVLNAPSSSRGVNTAFLQPGTDLPLWFRLGPLSSSAATRNHQFDTVKERDSHTASVLHSLEDTKSCCRPLDDATLEDSYRLMALCVLHIFSKHPIEKQLRLPCPLARGALRQE